MTANIYLLLGSNLGNRQENLRRAAVHLNQEVGRIVCTSGVYETAAWGKIDQKDFLNQVLQLECDVAPEDLLTKVLAIEKSLGRVRTEKWGERNIDIDILYYGDTLHQSDRLTLPHPGIEHRRFVLVPLCEIAPTFVHPLLKKDTTALLRDCCDPLTVKKIG